jgi:hemin uptake protein HemP
MTEKQSHPEQQPSDEARQDRPRVIDADDLFQGSREVLIDHEGVRYRLRITRRKKLILQK